MTHTQTPHPTRHENEQAKACLARRLESDRLLHGALTEEKEKRWEEAKREHEKLLGNMQVGGWVGARDSGIDLPHVCSVLTT